MDLNIHKFMIWLYQYIKDVNDFQRTFFNLCKFYISIRIGKIEIQFLWINIKM